MVRVLSDVDELVALTGSELGRSEWVVLNAARVDPFLHVTQSSIGYLVLAMIPVLSQQIWRIDGLTFAVNGGLNRLRFPEPVAAGARVQLRSSVVSVRGMRGGAHLVMAERLYDDVHPDPVVDAETVTVLRF